MKQQPEQHIDSNMSFKYLTLCTLVLLISIGATWAERSKTLQPRPVEQLRQSKDLRYQNNELYSLDDEDGDDIVEDELDAAEDEAAQLEQDKNDLDQLNDASVDELTKLIDGLEAMEQIESRAANNRAGKRSNTRRNRSGSNKVNRRNGNRRKGNRRHNRRGNSYRGGNKRNRNSRRRKNGAQRVNRGDI
nr:translation initiation factor IF-2 [Drosophila virilis]